MRKAKRKTCFFGTYTTTGTADQEFGCSSCQVWVRNSKKIAMFFVERYIAISGEESIVSLTRPSSQTASCLNPRIPGSLGAGAWSRGEIDRVGHFDNWVEQWQVQSDHHVQ